MGGFVGVVLSLTSGAIIAGKKGIALGWATMGVPISSIVVSAWPDYLAFFAPADSAGSKLYQSYDQNGLRCC